MLKKLLVWITLTALAASLLAGCGGSSPSGNSSSPPNFSSPLNPPQPPAHPKKL